MYDASEWSLILITNNPRVWSEDGPWAHLVNHELIRWTWVWSEDGPWAHLLVNRRTLERIPVARRLTLVSEGDRQRARSERPRSGFFCFLRSLLRYRASRSSMIRSIIFYLDSLIWTRYLNVLLIFSVVPKSDFRARSNDHKSHILPSLFGFPITEYLLAIQKRVFLDFFIHTN